MYIQYIYIYITSQIRTNIYMYVYREQYRKVTHICHAVLWLKSQKKKYNIIINYVVAIRSEHN